MPFAPLVSLPSGSEVLIDANIFIYGLLRSSAQCAKFLDRCNAEDVYAFTTVEIINEVSHRLMVYEAYAKGIIPKPTAAALKSVGSRMCDLSDYWVQTARIMRGNFCIMSLDKLRVEGAARLRRHYALLTNDSLLLSAADQFGITAIASNDADFAPVHWLQVYQPDDLPTSP